MPFRYKQTVTIHELKVNGTCIKWIILCIRYLIQYLFTVVAEIMTDRPAMLTNSKCIRWLIHLLITKSQRLSSRYSCIKGVILWICVMIARLTGNISQISVM